MDGLEIFSQYPSDYFGGNGDICQALKLATEHLNSNNDQVPFRIEFSIYRSENWLTAGVNERIRGLLQQVYEQCNRSGKLELSIQHKCICRSSSQARLQHDSSARVILKELGGVDFGVTKLELGNDGCSFGFGPAAYTDVHISLSRLQQLVIKFPSDVSWSLKEWTDLQSCFSSAENINELVIDGDYSDDSPHPVSPLHIKGIFNTSQVRQIQARYLYGSDEEYTAFYSSIPSLQLLEKENCWIAFGQDWIPVILEIATSTAGPFRLVTSSLFRNDPREGCQILEIGNYQKGGPFLTQYVRYNNYVDQLEPE